MRGFLRLLLIGLALAAGWWVAGQTGVRDDLPVVGSGGGGSSGGGPAASGGAGEPTSRRSPAHRLAGEQAGTTSPAAETVLRFRGLLDDLAAACSESRSELAEGILGVHDELEREGRHVDPMAVGRRWLQAAREADASHCRGLLPSVKGVL